MNVRELRRCRELEGNASVCRRFQESLSAGHIKPHECSLRDLAEALVPDGPEYVRSLDPRNGSRTLQEAEAVDTTAFANITGQIVYSAVLDSYQQEAFVLSGLIRTVPTRLDGEKIPGIAKITEDLLTVGEGMPYPHRGFGEDYINTPSTAKRGFVIPVTREAIFFDRTGLVLQRAGEVGEVLGINKEKRICDVVGGFTNNHSWKGTSYDTYQTATPWINVKASNELVDWTDVDAAEQLFADMLDPNTSEPVVLSAMSLVAMPAYRHAVNRVLNATEIRYGDGASSTTQTVAGNPLAGAGYRGYISRQLYRRILNAGEGATKAPKWWFLGDFSKAIWYMENWPITVTQAPKHSEAEFNNDIVVRFKASERGVPAVVNPRFLVKSYDTTDL